MAALSTILMGALVAATAAGTASSIINAKKGADAQERGLEQQKKAQAESAALAQSQQRSSQRAMNAADVKTPDVTAIMQAARGSGGGGSTMLTGPAGVAPNALSLGKSSLLGS